jgi:hypothetical protein
MQRERDEPTNRSDSPKVPIVSIFDFEEACQGEGNVHGAKRKSAVNTNHHRWSHLNLVNDKERENEDCMPRVSILLGDYKHPPPPGSVLTCYTSSKMQRPTDLEDCLWYSSTGTHGFRLRNSPAGQKSQSTIVYSWTRFRGHDCRDLPISFYGQAHEELQSHGNHPRADTESQCDPQRYS